MYSLTLQNAAGDSVITGGDILGRINFAVPAESDGFSATYISSFINCSADGVFTSGSNPAGLVFGVSSADPNAATGVLKISSDGHFYPLVSGIYDLGASSYSFRNIYANSGNFDQLIFNTNLNDPDLTVGQLQWNSTEGTLDLGLNDSYAMHLGEEMLYRVRNVTGSTLLAGQPVYASGLTPGGNNRIEVNLYVADGTIREVRFMGLMTEDLTDAGNNGFATHFGYIRNVDTRGDAATYGTTNKLWASGEPAWNEGDILYVHPTVAGKLTKIEPKHSVSVAIVTNKAINGKLFVRPTSYGHLDDNHDVAVSGATNGQFLQYNSATDYWVPSSSGNFTTLLVHGTPVPTGVGTNNYVTRWTGINVLGTGLIYDDGTNVGIGTSLPSARLNIEGGNFIFNDSGDNYDFRAGGLSDPNLLFVDASSDGVGIGTNAPASKLHVNGEIRASGNLVPATDNTGAVGTAALTWNNGQFTNLTVDSTLTVTSTLNVRAAIDLADADILRFGTADDWEFYHNGTHNYIDLTVGDMIIRDDGTAGDPIRLYLTRAGNLGVGVSSAPQATLEVVGGASVPFQVGDINGSQPFFSVRAGSAFISAAFGRSSAQANCRIQYYSNPATSGNYWRQDADETSFSLTRVASEVADTTVFKLQNGAATFNNAFTLPSVDGLSGQALVTNGSGLVSWTNIVLNQTVNGRLTLESGVSVSTTDQTAKTTLYFTPHLGNQIALYDGTEWKIYSFSELSLSLSGYTANTNYDIFIYNNSGTLTLESTAWTNDTTRATSLVIQDGIYVKSGSTTRRYLGTIRTTGTAGQCEDSLSRRFVWNLYNQSPHMLYNVYIIQHTYATQAWRAFNNNTTIGAGRQDLVIGLSIPLDIMGGGQLLYGYMSAALDSTTVPTSTNIHTGATTVPISTDGTRTIYANAGYHYVQAVQFGISAASTFYNAIVQTVFLG